jgi:hypothetical protein
MSEALVSSCAGFGDVAPRAVPNCRACVRDSRHPRQSFHLSFKQLPDPQPRNPPTLMPYSNWWNPLTQSQPRPVRLASAQCRSPRNPLVPLAILSLAAASNAISVGIASTRTLSATAAQSAQTRAPAFARRVPQIPISLPLAPSMPVSPYKLSHLSAGGIMRWTPGLRHSHSPHPLSRRRPACPHVAHLPFPPAPTHRLK